MSKSTKDYDYDLPEALIAQNPVVPRDQSRLLRVIRHHQKVQHRRFDSIIDCLGDRDVLVFNDTRVIAARLYGKVEGMSEAKAEVLLIAESPSGHFQCMVKPGRRFKVGKRLFFPGTRHFAEVAGIEEDGTRLLAFDGGKESVEELIASQGQMPLPPYIRHSKATPEQYQTVYARSGKSIAAPTAGLHFTHELMEGLKQKGVQMEFVNLTVGRGTFLGVESENLADHKMHTEAIRVGEETVKALNLAKDSGKRIIAVGTTSVRTLESASGHNGRLTPFEGETDLFIYPGYHWRFVDAMITNFHLPKSTLLMLVSAFAGREYTLSLYREAIENRYRFYSFGDAMFVE